MNIIKHKKHKFRTLNYFLRATDFFTSLYLISTSLQLSWNKLSNLTLDLNPFAPKVEVNDVRWFYLLSLGTKSCGIIILRKLVWGPYVTSHQSDMRLFVLQHYPKRPWNFDSNHFGGEMIKHVYFCQPQTKTLASLSQPRYQSSSASSDVTSPPSVQEEFVIALGSKPPPLTQIVRIGLETRLALQNKFQARL